MSLPAWYLEGFESSSRKVLQVVLTSFPFSIGRAADCNLPLNSLRVSQRHAELFTDGEELWLRDRDSTNGTFVNGRRLASEQIVRCGDIVHFADLEFRLNARSLAPQHSIFANTLTINKADLGGDKYREFRGMLATKAVQVLLQPVVNLHDTSVMGYECLGRGTLDGKLVAAQELFMMAEILGLAANLSRLLRDQGAAAATQLKNDFIIFLNTHPTELNDQDTLLESLQSLRRRHPELPLILEVHESAITNPVSLGLLRDRLVECNVGVAFDDFGVGQARLNELSDAAPSYLKFDLSLIRNLHRASQKRRGVVNTLVQMALDMDIVPIAEGIETREEAQICKDIGFTHGQGFFLGRPMPATEFIAK